MMRPGGERMSRAGRKRRVRFARSSTDASLNRSYDYDQVGRLWEAHTGNEADAHVAGQPLPGQPNGPYSHSYRYDQWGNMTTRVSAEPDWSK